jgi:hypothetical protein
VRRALTLTLLLACSKAQKQPEPVKVDPQLVVFCANNHFKMMDCFKDDQLWDIFATMYFAKHDPTVSDDERKRWIGKHKDDALALFKERGFEKSCEVSLLHNKAPTAKSVANVDAARGKSCAEFASAYGYMVFYEGAFADPKP